MKKTNYPQLLFLLFFLLNALSLWSQECKVIYVTTNGASTGLAGTKANPANLIYGLSLVTSTDNQVWVATGTYDISDRLSIPSDVTIEGGFDSSTWIKSNNAKSIIHRDTSNILPLVNALVGLYGVNISNFKLQDITVTVDSATVTQESVYGIYLEGCSNYNIVRCEIITGKGGKGVDGQAGTTGVNGIDGLGGGPGNGNEAPEPGGAGGAGGSGTNGGGNGAPGGKWDSGNNSNGVAGLPAGCGGGGGGTSGGGGCSCGNPFSGCPGNCGGSGSPGGNGQSGIDGTSGSIGAAGAVVAGFYQPGGVGGNGTSGTDGCGGGGGGGGGGRQDCGLDAVGGSGGGGGGGGSGGTGGTGGTGGGGSFAIFLFNNGANGAITDCSLQPGTGGRGGLGGGGGAKGTGGVGGPGGPGAGPCGGSLGARGGNGGDGGNGGSGGDGITGASVAISENGGTAVTSTNNNGVPGNPPVISVQHNGCANAEVVFNATSAGNWDFGTDANPQTAAGSGPHSIVYTTTGRKTITFGGTTFTDYIGLFNSVGNFPSITPQNPNVNEGCPNSFSTTLVGTFYEWSFSSSATPDTLFGATLSSVDSIYFNAPGVYTVRVYVTTQCCGRVVDFVTVTVQPSATIVTLAGSVTDICENDPVTFTATPATYGNYEFFRNGVSVQNGTSNTYTINDLAMGDTITAKAIDQGCYGPESNGVSVNIVPAPVVVAGNDFQLCPDAPPVILQGFSPAGGTWTGTGISNNTTFTPATAGSGTHDLIYSFTNPTGCTGSDTIVADVFTNPNADFSATPLIALTSDSIPIAFSDLSSGAVSWSWNFGDGSSANIQNPSHLYKQAGVYTVSLAIVDANGCVDTVELQNYITIQDKADVYVPSAFSPNGDGKNDVLHVLGTGIKQIKLSIYNRWGQLVFETTDLHEGWDGTYHDALQDTGVFTYDLFAEFNNKTSQRLNGSVTLVR